MAYGSWKGVRGPLVVWAAGLLLGVGAGAIAASLLRHASPQQPVPDSLAGKLR